MEEKCLICNGKGKHSLLWRYNENNVSLCDTHARVYQHETDPDILMTEDQHYSIICNLIRDFNFQQIHIMKQNANYMAAVMESWSDGCLSHHEATMKMATLADETRTIALSLLKGGDKKHG